jgi:peptidoglycan/xylan/chitin deacetylase (PgdA/CDA1 family)
MAHYRSRRSAVRRNQAFSPVVGFLLIASFGILFAGCTGPGGGDDEYVFTAEDAAKFHNLAQQMQNGGSGAVRSAGSMSSGPYLEALDTASGSRNGDIPVLDLSMVKTYSAVRASGASAGPNMFRVTNEFLNVRAEAAANAATVSRLNRGDAVEVIEFINARWAKVKVGGGLGYVSTDYIARLTSEDKLAEEKKKYEGQYFVNFGFVNMRKDKNAQSEKLGEIPGQTILTPKRVEGDWMFVSFGGKDGYVSTSYLKEFLPNFLVRQDTFKLPVIQYRLNQGDVLKSMPDQLAKMKQEGVTFLTLREFSDLLLRQEQRDVRLNPKTVSVIVTGITPSNVKEVSDILGAANVKATLFLQTKDIGLNGITEKTLMTLLANGFDLQSAGHTGDDLRSLTNAQIELELKQSRQLLEEYTKKSVFALAYPQGGANDRVMQLTAEAGYLFGITGEWDSTFSRDELLRMPSLVVFPTTSADEIVRAAKGS